MRLMLLFVSLVAAVVGVMVISNRPKEAAVPESFPILAQTETTNEQGTQLATFGSGCFWCTEAVFQLHRGVKKVVSGYTGGTTPNPTYEQICTGKTGHAEVIQVTFDPKEVTYPELLELFWRSHDPTTKDRQGNDWGTQYRSAVFYHNEKQKELAEDYKKKIDAAHVYPAPIVTEITPVSTFYPAETYHQNYYNTNPRQGYCQAVIGPKVEKLKKVFADKLKAKSE